MEYAHISVSPLIKPGFDGTELFTTTDKVLAADVPQKLLATTEIFPPVARPGAAWLPRRSRRCAPACGSSAAGRAGT